MTAAEAQPGWWERTAPTGPILRAAGIGVLLVALALYSNWCVCLGPEAAWQASWCTTVAARPPWTLLSGLAAAPSLLLLWIWRTTHRVEDIDIAQQSQITGRFVSAIQLLSDEKMASRLGGIYSLERVAGDEIKSYRVVVETLSAFVRAGLPLAGLEPESALRVTTLDEDLKDRPPTDLQAALTVLGRIKRPESESFRIDLSWTNLRRIDLIGADLSGVLLTSSRLCNLNFYDSKLIGADLRGADLEGAILAKANMLLADLNLADLSGANLEGANLSKAKNLTQEQVDSAVGDSDTQLPEGITRPAHWK